MTGDWTGEPQLGTDPQGDAPTVVMGAGSAGAESNIVVLHYDMVNFAAAEPPAENRSVATPQDTPLAVMWPAMDSWERRNALVEQLSRSARDSRRILDS